MRRGAARRVGLYAQRRKCPRVAHRTGRRIQTPRHASRPVKRRCACRPPRRVPPRAVADAYDSCIDRPEPRRVTTARAPARQRSPRLPQPRSRISSTRPPARSLDLPCPAQSARLLPPTRSMPCHHPRPNHPPQCPAPSSRRTRRPRSNIPPRSRPTPTGGRAFPLVRRWLHRPSSPTPRPLHAMSRRHTSRPRPTCPRRHRRLPTAGRVLCTVQRASRPRRQRPKRSRPPGCRRYPATASRQPTPTASLMLPPSRLRLRPTKRPPQHQARASPILPRRRVP